MDIGSTVIFRMALQNKYTTQRTSLKQQFFPKNDESLVVKVAATQSHSNVYINTNDCKHSNYGIKDVIGIRNYPGQSILRYCNGKRGQINILSILQINRYTLMPTI